MTTHWPPTPQVGGPLKPQIPDGPVGRCGQRSPTVRTPSFAPVCALPAGHAGWHRCDEGAEWNDPDGPITPADIHQMTRYATETREPAQIPAEAVDAVAGTLHRQYCPVPPSEHSPVALDVCLANRRAQAQRLLTDAAPLLIQAGREAASRDLKAAYDRAAISAVLDALGPDTQDGDTNG